MTTIPQCFSCRHYADVEADDPGPERCAAFPGGIPADIDANRHDHERSYPGDRGIRYEPRTHPRGHESAAPGGPAGQIA